MIDHASKCDKTLFEDRVNAEVNKSSIVYVLIVWDQHIWLVVGTTDIIILHVLEFALEDIILEM